MASVTNPEIQSPNKCWAVREAGSAAGESEWAQPEEHCAGGWLLFSGDQ